MKKKWKYLLGAGAIALGVYALWPSNENLETKVEEPVETYNIDKAELRKRFLEINKKIKLPEEVKEEEDSDLPSCLQCDDWRPKVKPEWYDNGQLKLEKTYCCGELHGKQKYWYKNGQLEKIEEYFCGKKEGEHIKWHENGEKWVEGRYHNGKEEGKWVESENYYERRMEIIADYANGKKHGKEFRFEDGRLTREMDYKFDERDGKDIIFNRQGGIKAESEYVNGEPIKSFYYYSNGQLNIEDHPWHMDDKSRLIRKWIKYDQNGNIEHIIVYEIVDSATMYYEWENGKWMNGKDGSYLLNE